MISIITALFPTGEVHGRKLSCAHISEKGSFFVTYLVFITKYTQFNFGFLFIIILLLDGL